MNSITYTFVYSYILMYIFSLSSYLYHWRYEMANTHVSVPILARTREVHRGSELANFVLATGTKATTAVDEKQSQDGMYPQYYFRSQ